MKIRTPLGVLGASIALLAIGTQPMLAAGGLRVTAEAGGAGIAAVTAFGSDLSSKPFPNEAGGDEAQTCDEAPLEACTRVMVDAYGANGRDTAPRDGVIDKIRIIAMDDGSARLFMARLDPSDPSQAKVTRKGPTFSYIGQPDSGPVFVNVIDIPDMVVKKGERIAIKAVKFSGLRGGSGSGQSLDFQPGLLVGAPYAPSDTDGWFMLVQAIYR
jgi:hypothetical protein